MTKENLGINNLKMMISFMVAMANAVGKALQDGDVSMWDLRYLMDPAVLAIDAFKNAGAALEEFQDMDDDEKSEIYDHIEEEFDLDYDGAEEFVEKGLKAAVTFGDLICDVIKRYQDETTSAEDSE